VTLPDDPYARLGVERDASAEDVRRAYFRLVRQNPPEAHPEEFKRIRAAYETLRSPLRRAELALMVFGGLPTEVDLDLVARAAEADDFDAVAALLAVELSVSDLARTDFPEDLLAIHAEDLLRDSPGTRANA
jgi:curved DNA-binding protein CbpA